MQVDARERIEEALKDAIRRELPQFADVTPTLERPRNPEHGDFAHRTRSTWQRRRGSIRASWRKQSLRPARLRSATSSPPWKRRAPASSISALRRQRGRRSSRACSRCATIACRDAHRGLRVNVEFVSANPTGPLHVGHGRQAALGDSIATLLEWQGCAVTREFYYNDAGQQIQNLALSVRARAHELLGTPASFPEDGYHGEYIRELAQRYLDEVGKDLSDIESIRRFAVAELRNEQDRDLRAFGVKFDRYYLESSLYGDGRVDATIARLATSGATYEQEGALWLRTTGYGDDKDRVMRKSDGGYTYFVPDVAYHVTKFERGFAKAINVQGADHHGTIARVRAGLQALDMGIPAGYPDYVLHKMVTVMRGGEEAKISKRAGSYVTLRELIDEVGRDAVRFFLVSRKADSEFVFDIDLARSQSEENPVYYVQYAHARVASVLRQAQIPLADAPGRLVDADLAPLRSSYEDALLRRIADFPVEIATAARDLAPHVITFYLKDLAQEFHSYYNAERFLVDDERERQARLALVVAVGQVLRNGLAVLGISAPEQM